MRLIAVGRLRAGPEAELFARYNARLRPALAVTEVAEGHGAPAEAKRRESEALLAALPGAPFVVPLDQGGPAESSEALAVRLERWLGQPRTICFVVGGAEGLDAAVLARADAVLSLGPLTWPHMLARVLLAEQLFRARAIASGHPYHRGGRPIGSEAKGCPSPGPRSRRSLEIPFVKGIKRATTLLRGPGAEPLALPLEPEG